jgi:hypothetical protein
MKGINHLEFLRRLDHRLLVGGPRRSPGTWLAVDRSRAHRQRLDGRHDRREAVGPIETPGASSPSKILGMDARAFPWGSLVFDAFKGLLPFIRLALLLHQGAMRDLKLAMCGHRMT